MDNMNQEAVMGLLFDAQSNTDLKDQFREALSGTRDDMRSQRKWLEASRINRVLRREKLFDAVYQQAAMVSAAQFVHSEAFGDGEFGKWFLDWFSNGGWEVIVEFIKALIGLF